MATTIVEDYTKRPLNSKMKLSDVRELCQEALEMSQGDCDKASDMEGAWYYQGVVDVMTSLLETMTTEYTSDQLFARLKRRLGIRS